MLVTLNDVLPRAQKNGYAVGLFNTTDTDMLQAAIEAAEELRSPIIIGTAEVLLPYGELQLIGPSILHAARNASVPVVVHFDHGLSFDRCIEALKLGFTSVMFDGSAHPYEENLAMTREMVKIAHSMGASVEGEIGHIGAGEMAHDDDNAGVADTSGYTTPEEAVAFVKETGVDALAIAIGTAHGPYRKKPKLDIPRLKQIRAAVNTPLVLHGGSGLSDEDFRNTVEGGISKVNIYTDLCEAGDSVMRQPNPELHYLQVRAKKVEAIKEAIKKKIRLFGSDGTVWVTWKDLI